MNLMSVRQRSSDRTQRGIGRKATLVCPTCGHESPSGTDGDWVITEETNDDIRRVAYDCPVCWTSVVVQPRFER